VFPPSTENKIAGKGWVAKKARKKKRQGRAPYLPLRKTQRQSPKPDNEKVETARRRGGAGKKIIGEKGS